MYSDDGDERPFDKVFGPSIFGSVIDPPAPAPPPTSVADSTAVPNADFQAQVETVTGHGGQVPPPEPGEPGGGGGQFSPEIQLDTSMTNNQLGTPTSALTGWDCVSDPGDDFVHARTLPAPA